MLTNPDIGRHSLLGSDHPGLEINGRLRDALRPDEPLVPGRAPARAASWSAGQLFVYNEKVREQNYYDSLCRLIDKTKRHCRPIRPECCIERPAANQQYSELIDKEAVPWLGEVPSAILGIGAYRYCQAYKRYLSGLAGKPKVHVIKESDRTLQLTRSYFTIKPTSSKKRFLLTFGSPKKPGGSIRFRRIAASSCPRCCS